MGGSYLNNTVNCEDTSFDSFTRSCSCVALGEDDDLCVHYFEELEFPNSDISGDEEIDDGLEFDEVVTNLTIFHDVDENENIFYGNASDESETLSNNSDSIEGSVSDGVSTSFKGKKSTNTIINKSKDVTKLNTSRDKNGPQRIVSAIKGSRAKEGTKVESGLRVRWAPDVYDPPITSNDHTLKNVAYRPRSKSIRKEYYSMRYKHSTSKASQQGKSRYQNTNKNSSQKTINERILRLHDSSEKASIARLAAQKMQHAIGKDKATTTETKELKFEANFCRETVASTMHIPLAEAT